MPLLNGKNISSFVEVYRVGWLEWIISEFHFRQTYPLNLCQNNLHWYDDSSVFYGQQEIQTRYSIINEAYHKCTVHNHNYHLSFSCESRTCAVSLWCGNTLKAPRARHPCADVLFLPHYPSVLQRSPDSAGHSRHDITHPPHACVYVYVCVLSMFVPGTLPKVSLPPCLPNKQKKVQCFSAWTNPTFAFSCASEQAGDRCPSRSPHPGSPMFTFLAAVVLLPLDFSVLSPCQSPGASRVPSPGIKKQLKRLMHSSKDEQPAVNILIFNT